MKIILLVILLISPLKLSAIEIQTLGGPNDQKAHFKIETHPSDASVTFLRHDSGDSVRGSSQTLFQLPYGDYQLTVSAHGFLSYSEIITIRKSSVSMDISLEPVMAMLFLSLDPPDAVVKLAGKVVKPKDFPLQVGRTHVFQVSHPDYLPNSISITPSNAETVFEDVNLEPKLSSVQYEIYPYGAKLVIDGEEFHDNRDVIYLPPGKRHVKITKMDFFEYEEVLNVEPNKIYPLKVINLKSDSEDISPSDKKIAYRFEYNPASYQGTHGRLHLIPFGLHLESRFLSIGFGFNQHTDEREWVDDNNNSQIETKDYFDCYVTVRLISPKLYDTYKFYLAGTYGSISKEVRTSLYEEKIRKSFAYQGYGAGIRAYTSPRWSYHLEHYQVQTLEQGSNSRGLESRTLFGFGYEF